MRFLITGRISNDNADELFLPVRHLAPIAEMEVVDENAAREELASIYPGEAIYHLRLWCAVTCCLKERVPEAQLDEQLISTQPVAGSNPVGHANSKEET